MDNKFDEDANRVEFNLTAQMSVGVLKEFVYGNTICSIVDLQIFHHLFLFFEDIFELAKGGFHLLQ